MTNMEAFLIESHLRTRCQVRMEKNPNIQSFDFTRLGVRVPAILVSPFVEKGQVDSTIYEHSSLPATIKTLFDLPESLTARDKAGEHVREESLPQHSP